MPRSVEPRRFVSLKQNPDSDKKKDDDKKGVWATLNQPLIIFLLTTVFVAAAGSYFTTAQKCDSDAEATYDKLISISDEITGRVSRATDKIYSIASRAHVMPDVILFSADESDANTILALLRGSTYLDPAYQNHHIKELVRNLSRVWSRVDVGNREYPMHPMPEINFAHWEENVESLTLGLKGAQQLSDEPSRKSFLKRALSLVNQLKNDLDKDDTSLILAAPSLSHHANQCGFVDVLKIGFGRPNDIQVWTWGPDEPVFVPTRLSPEFMEELRMRTVSGRDSGSQPSAEKQGDGKAPLPP